MKTGAIKALLVGALALVLLAGAQGSALGAARLDRSFGDAGFVPVEVAGAGGFVWPPSGRQTIALDPSGRLLVGGSDKRGFAVSRYRANGRLDRSFGENGVATVSFGEGGRALNRPGTVAALAVQPDGRILLAGNYEGNPQDYCEECSPEPEDHRAYAAVVRLDPDGSLDPRFGGDRRGRFLGIVKFRLIEITDLAIRGGRILIAGARITPWPQMSETGFLARLRLDGEVDRGFGEGGWSSLAAGKRGDTPWSSISALAFGRGGKIYGGGYDGGRFLLARFGADGRRERGFGNGGVLRLRVGTPCACARGLGLTRDRRGRLLVSGYARFGKRDSVALVRVLPGGRLDRGFGAAGIARAPVGAGSSGRGVVVQPDGRIVVAAASGMLFQPRFTVVRLKPDGARDRSFFGGAFTAKAGGPGVQPLIDRAGRLLVAGEKGVARFLIGRAAG